jgi:uncharacterized membrane protein YdbT with pleckstrin-like domain
VQSCLTRWLRRVTEIMEPHSFPVIAALFFAWTVSAVLTKLFTWLGRNRSRVGVFCAQPCTVALERIR